MNAETIKRGPCGTFHSDLYTNTASTGNKTRGNTDTNGLINKGDKIFGAVKFCQKLYIPKISPTKAPTLGPSTRAPIKVGTCNVVTFKGPKAIMPYPDKPKIIVIAANKPTMVSSRNVRLDF